MLMADAAQYRHPRAPQEDGQTLVDPPRTDLPGLVARNRKQLAAANYDFQGRSLADLASSARRSLVEQAIGYTKQYRDVAFLPAVDRRDADVPMILSGHQPQLFHPGVWYKNFVLGQSAKEVGGIGIHLLIDSDLCRTASIRVPTGTADDPRVETVPFDRPSADVPFEERAVEDETAFDSFSKRVVEQLRPLIANPIVTALWQLTSHRSRDERNLGLRLARGRHALEGQWGNDTLELPQSAVCRLPEFAWFVSHLLAHLPRFWAAHNDALASYRRAHRLRNRAHPVPDLGQADDWLEAPLWMWSTDDPRRRPVFARQEGDTIVMTDRRHHTMALALSADRDAGMAAEQLTQISADGVKIRTRALATTLFARLVLSDLFLHGIGGARYDQVTDQIAGQFFGFSLPEFATASATLRLPIGHRPADVEQRRGLRQQVRELDYHPERILSRNDSFSADPMSVVAQTIAEKRRWLETPKTPRNARERHLAITAANSALQPFVARNRRQVEQLSEELEHRLRTDSILDSREYAFCLFPREHLQRLLDAARPSP